MGTEAYNTCSWLPIEQRFPMQRFHISEMEFTDGSLEPLDKCGIFLQSQTLNDPGNWICTSGVPMPQVAATLLSHQRQSSNKEVIHPGVLYMYWQQNSKATTGEKHPIERAKTRVSCDVDDTPVRRHQPEMTPELHSPRNQRKLAPKKVYKKSLYQSQKTEHSRVEKRYRESLNAKFDQLEDIIRTCNAAKDVETVDGMRKKGRTPGRKALILQNAYDCIAASKPDSSSL
ncbi:hypothetical protein BDV37DRAFT_289635 [Aspergillus pseudonomiae]|uniref:BHLH domain-containing protein n=1 Tax=Aspergillus pseudonomiae TaxID=1506151 RepID=A0A5N7CSR9_9EURO|nr:uncharacterized protein BDV37DRAFT_289635 [Aspergillus pseudonomiae]KAE8397195.1 hypothetical protein BDV37DRAFT_289635 [Aspergillus pseudonomiae]